MNCPGHIQIFKNGLRSYRELPVKIAEFGKVHRFEPSGALHGLMRVRAFTQDDAHIFITEQQIAEEALKVNNMILSIYEDFGFPDVRIKFSDRPDKRIGDDAVWDKAEAALTRRAGLRVELDLRNEKINYKVREHSLAKVPVLLVVGKKEAENRAVSIRRLGSQEQRVVGLDEALAELAAEAVAPDVRRGRG